MPSQTNHYDMSRIMSFHKTRIRFVIGAKNTGKTFTARVELIKQCIKHGTKFCELSRTADESEAVAVGYFSKLKAEGYFKEYIFKTTANEMYYAEIPEGYNEESEEWKDFKPAWTILGYFIALSKFQQSKKRTYEMVENFLFDEAVLDDKSQYHRYLKKEIEILGNIIDSLSREKTESEIRDYERETGKRYYKPKLYMLGNACDFKCPYLEWIGLKEIPTNYGFYQFPERNAILHYAPPLNSADEIRNTLAGLILAGNQEAEMAFENKFNVGNSREFIKKKPSSARFWLGIIYQKSNFGLWLDLKGALVYVNRHIPANERQIYTLTGDDMGLDFIAIKRTDTICKQIEGLYYDKLLRFDRLATKGAFDMLLEYLGVKLS